MISEIRKHPARIPVVYRNKPLMPMTWKRAKKYQASGKGKIKQTKLGIFYFQLAVEPSEYKTQRIVIGSDPGSSFDGFSVVSPKCHLLNLELIHTDASDGKKKKTKIKDRMAKRRMYRRTRRSRLRHRPVRNKARNSSKINPTIRAKLEFRKFILGKLLELFPVKAVSVEDVAFNHRDKKYGKYFSLAEIGKTEYYRFIQEDLGLEFLLSEGHQTSKNRKKAFGKDLKSKNKGGKTFTAHCLDSFVIGCKFVGIKPKKLIDCQSEVIFIRRNWMVRRELYRFKNQYKDKKLYFRYGKGGVVIPFKHFSRLRKIRVKISEDQGNHGPWEYQYTEPVETFKMFRSKYGGTVAYGQSRSNVERGVSKKKLPNGMYQNQLWERVA